MARHLTVLGPEDGPPGDGPDPPAAPLRGAIVHVAVTRADVTALAPVITAVRRASSVPQALLHAGAGAELAQEVAAQRRLPAGAGTGSGTVRTASALTWSEGQLTDLEPSVLVVSGSSDAALGCALAAAKLGVPIDSLGAGVRDHDWRAPREVNRVLMDTMADILFAPTRDDEANLAREGVQESRLHVVGSTVVAAAVARAEEAVQRAAWGSHALARGEYAYVTLGRRTTAEHDERLARVVEAVAALALRTPVVLALESGAGDDLKAMGDAHRLEQAGVRPAAPAGYLDHLSLMAGSGAVVTDSGSVQEEASALGVPCYTLGTVTENGMTLTSGTNTLLGADARDMDAVRLAPRAPKQSFFARWHAGAAERVAAELVANYALVRATSAS